MSAEDVLAEIINLGSSADRSDYRPSVLSPGFTQLKSLAALLASEPAEEALQQYLQGNPHFLMSLFGSSDDGDLALFAKPRVGTSYIADFGLLLYGQGGAGLHLVEIERSSVPLFTSKGTPSRYLQAALGQVDDWHQWSRGIELSFLRETVEAAKKLPLYNADEDHHRGFRFKSPEQLDEHFRGFGGFDYPSISYSIIIGRWAKLSEAHRKRLVFMNTQRDDRVKVFTYDQLARQALVRPHLSFF